MLALVSSMVSILLVAGLVVAYVAFPSRGRDLPAAPWLGDALRRVVAALPVVGDGDRDGGADTGPADHTDPPGDTDPAGDAAPAADGPGRRVRR